MGWPHRGINIGVSHAGVLWILPLVACARMRRAAEFRTVLAMIGCVILSGLHANDLRIGRGGLETILATILVHPSDARP